MKKKSTSREWFKVYGPMVLIVAIAFCAAYQFVGPAPAKNITLATGSRSGAYYGFGLRYADFFKRSDVELTVLETDGSIDNLSLLTEEGRNIHAALIQGGIGKPEAFPDLESLGSLYYEPLWLFHTKTLSVNALGDLKGRRIVLGNPGSGNYALAAQLLADNGVTPQTARFTDIGDMSAAQALSSHAVDALFVVAGTRSEKVRTLLQTSGIAVYSFRRAEAYVRNYKYLSRVLLPEGSLNLQRNIPSRDIALVAASANLIVRRDLHPALMYLFMMAADEIHRPGGLLEATGAFPSPAAVSFPLNKEARRFYKSGPPFLMRVLPFWIATWLVRMFVMVIPLLTIVYPLLKIAPPVYKWRIRSKVNKYYKRLHELDMDVAGARSPQDVESLIRRLDDLKLKASAIQLPASHMESLYALRQHMELTHERIEQALKSEAIT